MVSRLLGLPGVARQLQSTLQSVAPPRGCLRARFRCADRSALRDLREHLRVIFQNSPGRHRIHARRLYHVLQSGHGSCSDAIGPAAPRTFSSRRTHSPRGLRRHARLLGVQREPPPSGQRASRFPSISGSAKVTHAGKRFHCCGARYQRPQANRTRLSTWSTTTA